MLPDPATQSLSGTSYVAVIATAHKFFFLSGFPLRAINLEASDMLSRLTETDYRVRKSLCIEKLKTGPKSFYLNEQLVE